MKQEHPPSIFLFFHGRFPSEKAAALFAAHSADSFEYAGVRTRIIAPYRFGRASEKAQQYYGLSKKIDVRYIPTVDVFWIPFFEKIAFYISYGVFSVASLAYVLLSVRKVDFVYTNEALPALLISVFHRRTIYEMHDFPERFMFMYKLLCRKTAGVITTNNWKKEQLVTHCGAREEKIFVELNAVDLDMFRNLFTKEEARKKLAISRGGDTIALYTGHLYGWKGVDILALAAKELPDVDFYFVGGTVQDVAEFRIKYKKYSNVFVVGHRPHTEIPLWQAAADVLVLPNTAKESISMYATSPMKLFEYMASGRPIVASRLPSVQEIISDKAAVLVEADDPKALAEGIQEAFKDKDGVRVKEAKRIVQEHTWDARAQRIVGFIANL